MEGMKQFISLDENNKLLIKGNAIISEKGVTTSFDGEFVMYGRDVQRLMVLLNEGNYLRREEILLSGDDGCFGYCGWNTFAILKDEQVAEMLKKQDTTIKELRDIERRLSDNVKTRVECEKTLSVKIDMLEAERKALKKEIEKLEIQLALNGRDDSDVLKKAVDENVNDSKSALKRFFSWFKKKSDYERTERKIRNN